MANPIMHDPDETEEQLVQTFAEFVQTHWFFNPLVQPTQKQFIQRKLDEQEDGENYD